MARDIKGKKDLSAWNLLSLVQAEPPLTRRTNSYQVLKICTLHIREVKCNVRLQIHCYSKHETNATAGRDTEREIKREERSSNKVYITVCGVNVLYSIVQKFN